MASFLCTDCCVAYKLLVLSFIYLDHLVITAYFFTLRFTFDLGTEGILCKHSIRLWHLAVISSICIWGSLDIQVKSRLINSFLASSLFLNGASFPWRFLFYKIRLTTWLLLGQQCNCVILMSAWWSLFGIYLLAKLLMLFLTLPIYFCGALIDHPQNCSKFGIFENKHLGVLLNCFKNRSDGGPTW